MGKSSLLLAGILSTFAISAFADTAPANTFTLTTEDFLDKGLLPVRYTCDGKDLSPQLSWTGSPAKTASFALILSDQDAPGGTFYHWVLYNIPKTTTSFPEGIDKLPAGTIAGKNDFGKQQYNGPCPPKGTSHYYTFTLYALDNKLNLPAGADAKTLIAAMQSHILDKTTLTFAYSRWLK